MALVGGGDVLQGFPAIRFGLGCVPTFLQIRASRLVGLVRGLGPPLSDLGGELRQRRRLLSKLPLGDRFSA